MLAIQGGTPVVTPELVAPWPTVTHDDRRAVQRAIDTATPWHWPMAPVTELEDAWAEFTGTSYALACNSGTAALHMCVSACGVEPGDEVLVPADTFLASASCVLQANAIPVFVDVDPVTYNIDSTKVEERITDHTRAIVAVDLHGLPAAYDALRQIASRHHLLLIEDGSQAHGASYHGRAVGALGDVAACSLNGSKCLSALGEGGLFTTDDEQRRDYAARVLMFGEELPGRTRDYNARIMGWNYRVDVCAAAFARSQLRRLHEMSRVRMANGDFLTSALEDIPGIRTPVVPEGLTHVYFFYPLLVAPEDVELDGVPVGQFRRTVKAVLRAEGLEIDEWQPQPVPAQTIFQEMRGYGRGCPWSCQARGDMRYDVSQYPVARDICERRLVMGQSLSSFGPPNGIALMTRYGEAFHKVLVEHRKELVKLALAAG